MIFIHFEYDEERNFILDSMKYLEDSVRTSSGKCISFEPRKNQYNYVRIENGNDCSSRVGTVNKSPQEIFLNKDGCLYKKTIAHEFIHALGKFLYKKKYSHK